MVSTNTPFNGGLRQKETLIHRQFNAKHQARVQELTYDRLYAVNYHYKLIIAFLLLSLGIFTSQLNAQCNLIHPCGSVVTVNLDSDGVANLTPQMFVNFGNGNCSGVSATPSLLDCSNLSGQQTMTVTINNVAQCVSNPIKVQVVDVTGPKITCPSDVIVNCEDLPMDTLPAQSGMASAIDNCGGSYTPVPSLNAIITSTNKGVCKVVERKWKVTDNVNPADSCIQKITIEDTEDPMLDWTNYPGGVPPTDETIGCISSLGSPFLYPGFANDNCNIKSIETTHDTIGRGTDITDCSYYNFTVERVWTALDDCNNADTYKQIITVEDTTSPVFTPASSSAIEVNTNNGTGSSCTGNVSLDLTNDPVDCADTLFSFFEVRLQSAPNPPVRSGTGLNASDTYAAGIYDFKFTSIDPCGNIGTVTHVVEVKDLENPIADCESGTVTVNVRADVDYTIIDPVLIDDNSYDRCSSITLSVSPDTLRCINITGGTMPVVLTVKDANGNESTCTAQVEPIPSAPTPSCTNIAVDLDGSGTYTLTNTDLYEMGRLFRDTCYGSDNITFSVLPGQADFDCSDIGTKMVTLKGTSSGASGLSATCTATVTIRDMMAPVIMCGNPFTAYFDDSGRVDLEASWLLYSSSNGNTSTNGNHEIYDLFLTGGNDGSGDAGFVEYRLVADEAVSFDFNWTYNTDDSRGQEEDFLRYTAPGSGGWDTLSSTLNNPITVNLNAGGTFFIQLHTTDNKEGRATAHLNFSQNLSDENALNVSKWQKRIVKTDGKAEFAQDSYLTMDNCSSPFDVSYSVTPSVFTCDSSNQVVTVTATDLAGNSSDCSVFIQLEDNNPPVFECQDFTAQLGEAPNSFSQAAVFVEATWLLEGDRSIFMRSFGYQGNPNQDTSTYSVTSKSNVTFSFDWKVASEDSLIANEVFGYVKNGVFTQINTDADPKKVNNSGSESVSLASGDEFGFRILSNGDNLYSKVNITNISVPFIGDFDPTKWKRTQNQFFDFERVFIHGEVSDGCIDVSELNFEIRDQNGLYNRWAQFDCNDVYQRDFPVRLRINDGTFSDSCDATITIIDNIAPTAGCPLGFTKALDQDGYYILKDNNSIESQIMNLSDDNCDPYALTYSFEPDTLDCSNIGLNTVEVTVTDPGQNTSTCTFDVNIQDGNGPQILCPDDFMVDCSNLPNDTMFVNLGADTATATDNCTMSAFGYSDMLSTNPFPIGCFDIIRTWSASDAGGNSSTCSQTISVIDNVGLSINTTSAQADKSVNCESSVPAVVQIHPDSLKGCGVTVTYDTIDQRLDYNTSPPDTLYEPGDSMYYNFYIKRTWTATSGCNNFTTSHTQTITVEDRVRPAISSSYPLVVEVGTDSAKCSAAVNLELTSSDVFDCVEFQYLTITNNSPYALSNGADASGRYPLGTTVVMFTVTDLNGNSRDRSVDVIVRDGETPVMKCAGDNSLKVTLSSQGDGALSVSDVDRNSFDRCGLDSLYIAPSTFSCADIGTKTVTLTGIDASGNIGTCTTIVQIDQGQSGGSSLNINCPADMTIDCSESILPANTGTAVFTTGCGTGDLSYEDDKLVAPTCGTIIRTWKVQILNTTTFETCNQTITVEDNTAPTIIAASIPNDTTVNCAPHAIPDVMADDNCRGMFAVPGADTIVASTYDADPLEQKHYNYEVRRTWTANDSCSGTDVVVMSVFVQDTTKPVIAFPATVEIATDVDLCTAQLNIDLTSLGNSSGAYISDNCAANNHLTYTIDGVRGNSQISGLYNPGMYQFVVKVEDPSGNASTATLNLEVKDMQGPSAVCTQGELIVLPPNGGSATIDVTRINGGSTDNCTAVADLDFSLDNGTFGPSYAGQQVTIVLTVEDEAGNQNTCSSVATVIGGTTFMAPTISVTEASTGALVPVSGTNFQEVTSFGVNVEVADATVLDVTDLININPELSAKGTFISAPSLGGNGYTILWNATDSNSPANLNNGDKLFDLEVDVLGAAGETSAVTLGSNAVNKLVNGTPAMAASSVVDGVVSVVSGTNIYRISGTIKTKTDDEVNGVTIAQTGTAMSSVTTTTAGTYDFSTAGGSNITLTPSKNNHWKEGVTIADAIIALQYPTHAAFGSGYKVIAADANKSNSVTGHDAIQIFQLAIDPDFTSIPGNQSWRFVAEDPDLSNNTNPFGLPLVFDEMVTIDPISKDSVVNFIGMKIGDLNDDVDASLRTDAFEFVLENQTIETVGERIEVPFRARDFEAINGFQSTVNFETKQLTYVEAIPGILPNLTSFNFKDALVANGQLTMGWINLDAVDIADDEILFTLVFESKKSNFELEDVLSTSADAIPMEVVDEFGILADRIDLIFRSSVSSTTGLEGLELNLRQNVPNPFNDETVIGFNLPEAGMIQMNFMDVSGKLIHTVEGDFTQGYQEIRVRKEALPATGVVFYHLNTTHGSLVRKMIILE